ncbi:MAG TPA: chalcone isomerase family protein [Bacteroidota bacterium]|nr:chalcone isomerase family protein [Bacteroidota bacterium]
MKSFVVVSLLGLLVSVLLLPVCAQETVKEASTGKTFPVQLTITHEGESYPVVLTGTTVRKKVVFKVYGIAHYAQDPQPGKTDEVLAAMLTDGKAKQITMEFVRDVDVASIQTAYRDGFAENATADEAKAIAPLVEKFLKYFTRDVKEDDRFVLCWLPGGTVLAQTQGTDHPAITNTIFARVLWSIWLGEDSIVDQDDLVSRFAK